MPLSRGDRNWTAPANGSARRDIRAALYKQLNGFQIPAERRSRNQRRIPPRQQALDIHTTI
ncbi:hypothetical protein CCAX7_007150 [Capsulimonas corticalis]|uniref:Uncharacterized protein n=1 Tax=Capsulimonas corticalis TaxID=2219043 RepID=A0A402D1N1_9BACT|nr:hypothetical protein CCAX7_007150 [Capsulimonas corticalis]